MREFFAALQDIIRADEPAPFCRWCREDGTCMHCPIPEQQLTPEQRQAEAERMRAVREGRLPRW